MRPGRTFEYFNPPFVEMFGYDADDLPDKSTWFEKAYPDQRYRDHVMNAWSEYSVNVGDKGSLRSRRFIVCCKDGTEKHIHFRGSILGNGKHLMTYEDVTELVKAEEALRESEYRFKTVIESARDAIFMKDKDFQYTLINPAMAQWFNETVAGLTGKWDENFFDDRRSASSAKRI
jgi:PAS domain S-box-containing protein